MGQYYLVVNLGTKEYISPLRVGSSSKIMSHAYVDEPFMKLIETLLSPGNKWYKSPIVWAGDYADPETTCCQELADGTRKEANLYQLCNQTVYAQDLVELPDETDNYFRYIVNHDRMLYVDMERLADICHPLALLTVDGNGRGGGDYIPYSDGHFEEDLVGAWSRNVISVESERPTGDFKELKTNDVYHWSKAGPIILLRALFMKQRATLQDTENRQQQIVQRLVSLHDVEIFQTIVRFLI